MLKLVVALAILSAASADVAHILADTVASPVVAILRQSQDIQEDGSYQYNFETENGISVQQQGAPVLTEDSGTIASGSFQFSSPEGVPVAISYVADENGFQPSGDVLPTPPPIPSNILRSLEYNAAHASEE